MNCYGMPPVLENSVKICITGSMNFPLKPPFRERRDDIMLFASHFLQTTNEELGKKVKGFDPDVEEIFKKYVWFGNLRELKNVIKGQPC